MRYWDYIVVLIRNIDQDVDGFIVVGGLLFTILGCFLSIIGIVIAFIDFSKKNSDKKGDKKIFRWAFKITSLGILIIFFLILFLYFTETCLPILIAIIISTILIVFREYDIRISQALCLVGAFFVVSVGLLWLSSSDSEQMNTLKQLNDNLSKELGIAKEEINKLELVNAQLNKDLKILASKDLNNKNVAIERTKEEAKEVNKQDEQSITEGEQAWLKEWLEKWCNAWQQTEIHSYMGFYSHNFKSGKENHDEWEKRKTQLFTKYYKSISVKIRWNSIVIKRSNNEITIEFQQFYKAPNYQGGERKKTLVLREENDGLKIIAEKAEKF